MMAANHKQVDRQYTVGQHIIAEFYGCQHLNDFAFIKKILLKSAEEAKATIINSQFYQFEPHGITGLILLAESHISIHTWPEIEYAAVDVFTCGNRVVPEKAIEYLQKQLSPSGVKIKKIDRGIKND